MHFCTLCRYRDEPDLSDLSGNAGGRGFRKRCFLTQDNKTTVFTGPIWLPFFLQPRALIPLTPLDITFSLSKPSFAIRSKSPHTNYRFNFRKFVLRVPRMKVAPTVASRIEAHLANNVAKYPIRQTSTRLFTIPPGLKKWDIEPFGTNTPLPQIALVALVATSSVQGVQRQSPFYFNNFLLTDISMNLEGTTFPTPDGFSNLSWSGEAPNFMLPYFALFDYNTKEDFGNGIQLQEFQQCYSIFKFSLGNFLTASHDHVEPSKLGNCRLSLTFAAESRNPSLTIVVFTERNNVIGIDGQRQVSRDFVL